MQFEVLELIGLTTTTSSKKAMAVFNFPTIGSHALIDALNVTLKWARFHDLYIRYIIY